MSRRIRRSFWNERPFTNQPKQPPPARGIAITKGATTWWGKHWVEALERLSDGYSSRLARGRTYARAGRVHDLEISAGEVRSRVTGTRASPYKIRIALRVLPDALWTKLFARLASEARFSASLLAGEMPQEIDEAFRASGASLFPQQEQDFVTSCSCPDWANPCKHIAATHFVIGEAFDRDPFLLFELRGRTKQQTLDALRAARAKDRSATTTTTTPATTKRRRAASSSASSTTTSPVEQSASVAFPKIDDRDYDRLPHPLPSLDLRFEEPAQEHALLAQLGAPPSWTERRTPAEFFGAIVAEAGRLARLWALAEVEEESTNTEEPSDSALKPAAKPARRRKAVRTTKKKASRG